MTAQTSTADGLPSGDGFPKGDGAPSPPLGFKAPGPWLVGGLLLTFSFFVFSS